MPMKKILIGLLFAMTVNAVSAQHAAVRVNALGWATGTINAGIDVAVSPKWSVDVSGYWNPFATNHLRTNILMATVGVRRWRIEPHEGFFWGAHTSGARYNIGNRNARYKGWLAGVGSSIGYSWILSKRWNFTLEGGLGVFYMKDTRWYPNRSPLDDFVLHHYRRVVVAPSKLEVSFSYLF